MIKIPNNELKILFSRSSGKGGQNVNKLATRVQLKWKPQSSNIFNFEDRDYLAERLKSKLNKEGELIVECSQNRSQSANLNLARHKLAFLVQNALKRPKLRLKTRPSRQSMLKRLQNKRKISEKKHSRRFMNFD